jgi:hypothetical protein
MPDAATEPTAADLAHVLQRSRHFYLALHSILGESLEVGNHRDLLTQGTCGVAIEHGMSVCTLVEVENFASAIVLQRPQMEAVLRALWLHEIARDEWIERYFNALKANPTKDPNFAPKVPEMLDDLAKTRHLPAVRMLNQLKDAAWGPLNSYVHSGIHPVVQQHIGFPPRHAIQVLLNSNGLSGMAAAVMAIMTRDERIALAVREAQRDHLDCMPALAAGTPNPPAP